MSRGDLDHIQAQLKIAIQSHQILVARLKSSPQNQHIHTQLLEVQAQIRNLSEKQKSIVQQLKEMVTRQTDSQKPASNQTNGVQSTNMSTKPKQSVTNHNNNEVSKPNTNHAKIPEQGVTQSVAAKPPNLLPKPTNAAAENELPKKSVKAQAQCSPKIVDQNNQHPLKVPQFHVNRPSILSGGRQMTMRQQSIPDSPVKKEMGLSNSISSLKRAVLADRNKDLAPSERQKYEYMACLDLITPDVLKDLQSRRSERKRRSTANPQFAYGNIDLERRRPQNYLATVTPRPKKPAPAPKPVPQQPQAQPRKRGRPPKRKTLNAQARNSPAKFGSSTEPMTPDKCPPSPSPSSASTCLSEPSTPSSQHPSSCGGGDADSPPNSPTSAWSVTPCHSPHLSSRPATPSSWCAPSTAATATTVSKRSASDSLDDDNGLESPSSVKACKRLTLEEDVEEGLDDEQSADIHEDYCAVCRRSGELLMCDTCSLVYHLNCIEPSLTDIPTGTWSCPKCMNGDCTNGNWSGNLAIVHSYIQQKSAKEEEQNQLQKTKQELEAEQAQLEAKALQLKQAISQQLAQKQSLQTSHQAAQQTVSQMKNLIKAFHNA